MEEVHAEMEAKVSERTAEIETGINGEMVTLRLSEKGGMISTVTLPPDRARAIGKHLIGQANLISPPDGPEPGEPDEQ